LDKIFGSISPYLIPLSCLSLGFTYACVFIVVANLVEHFKNRSRTNIKGRILTIAISTILQLIAVWGIFIPIFFFSSRSLNLADLVLWFCFPFLLIPYYDKYISTVPYFRESYKKKKDNNAPPPK